MIIVTPGFAGNEADTSCLPLLQDFILAFRKYEPEFEIRIIALHYPYRGVHYHWNAIPVFNPVKKNGLFEKFMSWLRCWKELRTLRKQGKEFILVSWMLTDASLAARLYSIFSKTPHYAIAAGQDVLHRNRYLSFLSVLKSRIIVLNKWMNAQLVQSTGKHAVAIIPIATEVKSPPDNDRKIDLLVVGSLLPVKRVELALELTGQLQHEFQELNVEIIGDGPLRKKLTEQSSAMKLPVIFCGELKRELVLQKMQQSKILLHTSSYEGQSTVITEALASGMYVLCFDVGRIGSHSKLIVCESFSEMAAQASELLNRQTLDYAPVVLFTERETVHRYKQILFSAEIN